MALLEPFCRRHFRQLLRLQNPHLTSSSSSQPSDSSFLSSNSRRPFSLSSRPSVTSEKKTQKPAKALSKFFKTAISGLERTDNGCAEAVNGEPAQLKETGAKVNLAALFAVGKKAKVKSNVPINFGLEGPKVYEELPPEMQMFARCLHEKGYLDYANFPRKNGFDATCFETSYRREFLKSAAEKFAKDHQEIAKWLSASDLKKIALLGCPSYERSSVYAAKHMRQFFKIEEQKVCGKCTLRNSCKYANKGWNKSIQLSLDKVIQVLVMYAMGSVHEDLLVPEDINNSVNRLLKEIVNLSQLRQ
ncbi:Unknown protein [Striga hermonthica]|uniref:Uncharacterized protein n=1 Tax=Striga hermonthica TaxID=68872 RepID=A0A9N7R2N6_STRHE|nr:Unknown protein [Striga hermonthica]